MHETIDDRRATWTWRAALACALLPLTGCDGWWAGDQGRSLRQPQSGPDAARAKPAEPARTRTGPVDTDPRSEADAARARIAELEAETARLRARTDEVEAETAGEAEQRACEADLARARTDLARALAEREWPSVVGHRPVERPEAIHVYAGKNAEECDGCFFDRMQRSQASSMRRVKPTEASLEYAAIAADHRKHGCPGKLAE